MPEERDIISVNYVSPLVLRKELENLMDNEGAGALELPNIIKEKQVIFWNMVSMLFVSFISAIVFTSREPGKEVDFTGCEALKFKPRIPQQLVFKRQNISFKILSE